MKTSIKINLTYIALFWVIIWDPFQTYMRDIYEPLSVGYVQLIFVLLALSVEMQKKSFYNKFSRKPYIYWLLWILYSIVNTFIIHDYTGLNDSITFIYSLILPLLLIVVTSNREYPIQDLINVFIIAFLSRILLSLVFDDFNFSGRFGSELNSNDIAFGGLLLFIFIFYKKVLYGKMSKLSVIQIILALSIVIFTGSRKSFIALLIVMLGYIYANVSKTSLKAYFKYIPLIILVLVLVYYVSFNTTLGERLLSTQYKSDNITNEEQLFDGRMGYYIQGFKIFKENPITGVGLMNFGQYSTSRAGRALHTEYMVQLAEAGLIGTALWILFFVNIIKKIKLFKSIPNANIIYKYSIFVMLAVFFLMLGTWIYNMTIMFVLIGFIIRISDEYIHSYNLAAANNSWRY